MKKTTTEILIWIMLILPFGIAFLLWDKLPNQFTVHINSNSTSSKFINILSLPIVNVIVYIVTVLSLKLLVNKNQLSFFQNRINAIRLVIHSLITSVFIILVSYTLNNDINVFILLAYVFLIAFLVMGNYMNAIKPNKFFGVRTPWTLKDEAVWKKTHFLASRLWVFSSLLIMVIIPFLSQVTIALLLFIYLLCIMIIPIAYSYIIFKKQ